MTLARLAIATILILMMTIAQPSYAYTASRVAFEFHQNFIRIIITYTVPALRQAREATVQIRSKSEAEKIYWALVRGGDFYLEKGEIFFNEPITKPRPW